MYRGKILACSIKVHVEHDLYTNNRQPLALRALIRQHCMDVMKMLENGIVEYMEKHR